MTRLIVNGVPREAKSAPATPLLYALRNDLGVMSPKFGCGIAQCGSCSVLLDGAEVRSCIVPLSAAAGKEVTTVEGLPARWAKQTGVKNAKALHPVQDAWIEEQAPLCGFCQAGMMIKATELLEKNPSPSLADIKQAFSTGPSAHLCRCGSYKAIIESVQRASTSMKRVGAKAGGQHEGR
jgi:aerobic-type carbon monoxide dehydrogenase small subunit (CoxS/CutS family)